MKGLMLLDTDTRCGIYTFQLTDFFSDSGKDKSVNVVLSSKDKNLLISEGNFLLEDVCKYGIHLHSTMLDAGSYSMQVFSEAEQYGVDFFVEKNSSLGESVSASLKKHEKEIIFSHPCDSKSYPYDDNDLIPWFDKDNASDHIQKMLASNEISTDEASLLRSFVTQGFMIVENVFDADVINAINSDIDDAIEKKYKGYEYGSSKRIEHLHLHYDSIKNMWLSQNTKRYLDLIFGHSARPCQTLTFVFGSQQDAHQDTIHLTPFPAGYMCGVWIALQDIEEDSGELVVYPGSHREPRFRMSEMDCDKVANGDWSEFGQKIVPNWVEMSKKYTPMKYMPKKGTILIWHENLLHAGSPRKNLQLERRSMVIHYFAQGAIAYYDSTGMPGMAAPLSVFADSL